MSSVVSTVIHGPPNAAFYTTDLLTNWGEYASPIYHRRNLMIAHMLRRFHPRQIVEVAGAEGDLAETILETLASVQNYQWSDLVAEAVPLVQSRLARFGIRFQACQLNADTAHADFSECNCFVCTSLEHLVHDREILQGLPQGCVIALGLPSFDWIAHMRSFPRGRRDIDARYGDLISVKRYGIIRYNHRRALLMLIRKALSFMKLLKFIQERTRLFLFPDGPFYPNKLFVIIGIKR
jgi:hypothetical protein